MIIRKDKLTPGITPLSSYRDSLKEARTEKEIERPSDMNR
jgi:hypothetical protein